MRLYSSLSSSLTAHWIGAMCAGPVSWYTQITYSGCKRGWKEERGREKLVSFFFFLSGLVDVSFSLSYIIWAPFGRVIVLPRFFVICPSSNDQFYPFYTSPPVDGDSFLLLLYCLPQTILYERQLHIATRMVLGCLPGKILRSQVVAFPPFFFYIFLRLGHSRLLYRLEWLWK